MRGAPMLGVVLVAVATVAFLATASSGSDTSVPAPQAPRLGGWFDIALVVVLGAGFIALAVLFAALFSEAGKPTAKSSAQGIVTSLALLALLAALVFLVDPQPSEDELVQPVLDGAGEMTTGSTIRDDGIDVAGGAAPNRPLPIAAVAGLALVAAAGALAARRWARSSAPVTPEQLGQERRSLLAGLLDDAIDELRGHGDARVAVIAVWARMEAALAVAGLARHEAEAPLTFLARVLDSLEASGPAVQRLTWAFEVAMFSQHPVDRTTQLDAVDALIAVRDELRLLDLVAR